MRRLRNWPPSARVSGSRERELNPSQQLYGRAELPAACEIHGARPQVPQRGHLESVRVSDSPGRLVPAWSDITLGSRPGARAGLTRVAFIAGRTRSTSGSCIRGVSVHRRWPSPSRAWSKECSSRGYIHVRSRARGASHVRRPVISESNLTELIR